MKQLSVLLTLMIALTPLLALAGTSTAPVDIGSTGTVTVNPLTNTSIVKSQLQDNSGTAITVGQKTMTSSVPVAIASDQGAISASLTTSNLVIGHVINDTGSAVIGKVQLQDNSGTAITLGQKTMTSSVPVALASDQGPITASLTSSGLVIGAVTQSGTWTVQSGASFSTRADTFTATANGTTVDVHLAPLKSFSLGVKATGAVTSWTVVLECSLDNTNFTTVLTHTNTSPGDGLIMSAGTNLFPCMYFRTRASAITLGGGTNVVATLLGM